MALSILLVIAGLIGSIFPILPGIPLIFAGFLIHGLGSHWQDYRPTTVVIVGAVTVAVALLDFYAGAAGAKKYGASRWGVWGSIIGALVGILFFNIPGLILGPLLGAVGGELLSGKQQREAWLAGWGAFLGFLTGSFIRVVTAVILSGLFFYYLIV